MNKLGKRLAVMGLCACMGAASLAGCSGSPAKVTVATLDGEDIKLDLYTFMVRFNQAQLQGGPYASLFGDDMFNTDLAGDGTTYGETFKQGILENIEQMLLLEKHASEYNVALTDEEKASLTKAAEDFIAANDKTVLDEMCATQEVVERAMTLYAVQSKMQQAIYDQADTNVSDEEAAQKTVNYVFLSTAGTEKDEEGNTIDLTDEQKAEVKDKAQRILDAAKESQDLEAAAKAEDDSLSMISSSYGTDNGNLKEEVKTAAETLEDGQFADEPVEAETGYYVLQMKTTFDKDATETRKETIVQQRKADKFEEVTTAWKEEADFTVNDKKVAKLDFFDTFTLKPTEASTEAPTEAPAAETETESGTEAATEAQTAGEDTTEENTTEVASGSESAAKAEETEDTSEAAETEAQNSTETEASTEA